MHLKASVFCKILYRRPVGIDPWLGIMGLLRCGSFFFFFSVFHDLLVCICLYFLRPGDSSVVLRVADHFVLLLQRVTRVQGWWDCFRVCAAPPLAVFQDDGQGWRKVPSWILPRYIESTKSIIWGCKCHAHLLRAGRKAICLVGMACANWR